MRTIYDRQAVKENFLKKSKNPIGKFLIGFGKEIIGFTTEMRPCITLKIMEYNVIIHQKDLDCRYLFMDDAFVSEVDKVLEDICESVRILKNK